MIDRTLYFVDDDRFDAHRSARPHPECPERLAAARVGLRSAGGCWSRVDVQPVDAALLSQVHGPQYLERLAGILSGGTGHIDGDTYFCPESREAAWCAAGGGAQLATRLMSTPSGAGLALIRPPGHHATPSQAMGFCLLNNVAIAARAALAGGAARVAIVDWDVHHGNGTQDAFFDSAEVLFASLHQYPFYPGTGHPEDIGTGPGRGHTVNVGLPAGCGPTEYGHAFREVILPILGAFDPDLVLVSAGFDAHARDPLASMNLDTDSFAAMTHALLGCRLGLFLEGGYDLQSLEASVAGVAQVLAGSRSPELPAGRPLPAAEQAVRRTQRALARSWPELGWPV